LLGTWGGAQKSCTEGAKRQMDIGVVLARASELHAKISDAIERAMRYEFLQTTSRAGLRRSPNTGVAEVVAVENGLSSPSSSAGFDSKEYDSDSYDRGGGGGLPAVAAPSGAGDVNAEARSLSAIRDALEVLEEQLEALQAMQQQQRVDRDMALAELEESRGILLGMLKKHRGQEREVVREALAFAGEHVEQETEEEEDLPLPPYPMSIVIPNSSVASIDAQSPQFRSSPVCRLRASGAVKRLTLGGGQKLNDGENFHFWGADKDDDEEEEERGSVQEESTNLCHKEEEGEEAKKTWKVSGAASQQSFQIFRNSVWSCKEDCIGGDECVGICSALRDGAEPREEKSLGSTISQEAGYLAVISPKASSLLCSLSTRKETDNGGWPPQVCG